MNASKTALLGNVESGDFWDGDDESSSDESQSEDRGPARSGAALAPAAPQKKSAAKVPVAPQLQDFRPAASAAAPAPSVVAAVEPERDLSTAIGTLMSALGIGAGHSGIKVTDGTRVVTMTLNFTGSLNDLENGKVKPVLRCGNPNLAALFGSKDVSVLEIVALGYDNDFRTGFGVHATPKMAKNAMDHATITSGGEFLFEAKGRTAREFPVGKVLFLCEESDFKKMMAQHYPGIDENNVADSCRASMIPGMMLVPEGSAVLPAVKNLIAEGKALASANNEAYSGSELHFISAEKSYQIPKELVLRAANITAQSFITTSDSLNISQDLAFGFSRAHLSSATIESINSKSAKKWTDPTGLVQSLKTGNTLDKEVARQATLSIDVAVKYIAPAK